MSRRRTYGIGAVVIVLAETAWFIACHFQLVEEWVARLKASGGFGATMAGVTTNPVFFFLLAVSAISLAMVALKSNDDDLHVPSQTQEVSQSNPQNQSVVIHNYPGPPAAAVGPPRAARERQAEPAPNLTFLGARNVRIFITSSIRELPLFSLRGPGGEEAEALIVGVRNESLPGAARVAVPERAVAHILYYADDGTEIASILRACWLERKGDLVDFELGESLWLITALLVDRDRVLVPYYRREVSWMGDGITLVDEPLDFARIKVIELRIIGEFNRELFRVQMNCSEDEKGNPKLTTRER